MAGSGAQPERTKDPRSALSAARDAGDQLSEVQSSYRRDSESPEAGACSAARNVAKRRVSKGLAFAGGEAFLGFAHQFIKLAGLGISFQLLIPDCRLIFRKPAGKLLQIPPAKVG